MTRIETAGIEASVSFTSRSQESGWSVGSGRFAEVSGLAPFGRSKNNPR